MGTNSSELVSIILLLKYFGIKISDIIGENNKVCKENFHTGCAVIYLSSRLVKMHHDFRIIEDIDGMRVMSDSLMYDLLYAISKDKLQEYVQKANECILNLKTTAALSKIKKALNIFGEFNVNFETSINFMACLHYMCFYKGIKRLDEDSLHNEDFAFILDRMITNFPKCFPYITEAITSLSTISSGE